MPEKIIHHEPIPDGEHPFSDITEEAYLHNNIDCPGSFNGCSPREILVRLDLDTGSTAQEAREKAVTVRRNFLYALMYQDTSKTPHLFDDLSFILSRTGDAVGSDEVLNFLIIGRFEDSEVV